MIGSTMAFQEPEWYCGMYLCRCEEAGGSEEGVNLGMKLDFVIKFTLLKA